jgi:hypothetical protein
MTTNSQPDRTPVRASDTEREEVARVVQAAGGEGRLTMAETEERLAGVYAARFRHELGQYAEDLPSEHPPRQWPARRPRGPLAVHAAVVVVLATLLLVRWLTSEALYFWPGFPLFWLGLSVVVHARLRGMRWRYRDSSPA